MENLNREHLEQEFVPFLKPEANIHVKIIALEQLLAISADTEGKLFLGSGDKFIEGLVCLLKDENIDVVFKAYQTLINLSSVEGTAVKILRLNLNLAEDLVKDAINPELKSSDLASVLLANLTRNEVGADLVSKVVLKEETSVEKILSALSNLEYNPHCKLHYLAGLLGNLTMIASIRAKIMAEDEFILQKILPYITFKESRVRRNGVITLLKNCSFDTDRHKWLLGETVDLLPRLLLPLAGPEEFDDDDMEKLPDDLQYLPPDKERETDPEIRKKLVETIFKLCATKEGRLYVLSKNTYVIMREYHKWETDRLNFPAIINLIDILIGDEPEEGLENLQKCDIPEDLKQQFQKEDEREEEAMERVKKEEELERAKKEELELAEKKEALEKVEKKEELENMDS